MDGRGEVCLAEEAERLRRSGLGVDEGARRMGVDAAWGETGVSEPGGGGGARAPGAGGRGWGAAWAWTRVGSRPWSRSRKETRSPRPRRAEGFTSVPSAERLADPLNHPARAGRRA